MKTNEAIRAKLQSQPVPLSNMKPMLQSQQQRAILAVMPLQFSEKNDDVFTG